ncbi:MAG TPA: 3',5'-cyclic-nucleotide phosphodiesterase [Burkholderiaceae bacterium]|nr:3',5'-cyclic-nucleotide phosphodiesterase [Burkholderiaceae bacterium]
MLVDHDVLIDAGTGLAELSLNELVQINHVFITHSHLDHICCLPFLADSAGALREQPIVVHALPQTIEALRTHVFNNVIWPDFEVIPTRSRPFVTFKSIGIDEPIVLDGRSIVPLPAEHIVPAVGYEVRSAAGNSLVFSGDTGPNPGLWTRVNAMPKVKGLIIETAFCNREMELAVISRHLCPSMLTDELKQLEREVPIFITHLKPGEFELTMEEVLEAAKRWTPRMLANGHVFEL